MNDKRDSYLPIDYNECLLLIQAVSLAVKLAIEVESATGGKGSRTKRLYDEMAIRLDKMKRLLDAKQTTAQLEQEFELPNECRSS